MKSQKKSQKFDTISLKIPHEIVERIDEIAVKEDRTRSYIMRIAFKSFLEEYFEEKWTQDIISHHKKDKNQKTITHEEIIKKLGLSRSDIENAKL